MSQIDFKTEDIAPCGINCAVCVARLRERNRCIGCNLSGRKPLHCTNCAIAHCEQLKKETSKFCYNCVKYPCTRLKRLDKRYIEKYRLSLIGNLDYISMYGMEKFLKFENKKWECENCGNILSVHSDICLSCETKR